MSKEEQIRRWIKSSEDDREAVKILVKNKRNIHGLFFAHLVIEKILKALWVQNKNETPPKTHNLTYLHNNLNLNLGTEHYKLLEFIKTWNIEGRYTQYDDGFDKIATTEYVNHNLSRVNELKLCLLKKLQLQ
jgi:HEPN domain-containing protein